MRSSKSSNDGKNFTSAPLNVEVGPINLVKLWWNNKLIVGVFVAFGLIFSSIYAFSIKDTWTATAQVIPPARILDLSEYLAKRRMILDVESYVVDGVAESKDDDIQAMEVVFQYGFLRSAEAVDINKIIENSRFRGEKSASLDAVSEKREILKKISGKLKIVEPARNKSGSPAVLSYSTSSPELARNVLVEVIEQANKNVLSAIFTELASLGNTAIIALKERQQRVLDEAREDQELRLQDLERALSLAKRENIKEFVSTPSLDGSVVATDTLVLLGEKILSAQIDFLKSGITFKPMEYYRIERMIRNINSLKKVQYSADNKTFTYVNAPVVSSSPSVPQRLLVVFVGIILGAAVGLGFASILHYWRLR